MLFKILHTAVAIKAIRVKGIGLKYSFIQAPSARLLLNHCFFKTSKMKG